MVKQTNKKLTTDKYQCKNCGQKSMSPNFVKCFVRGYKCDYCGTVNYPINETLEQKSDD